MEFVTLLLSGHLILIFVTAFSPDENLNTEFSTAIDEFANGFDLSLDILPKYYDIELELDIEKDVFHGICNVSIDILNTARNIRLHSANLNITDSTLIDAYKRKHKLHNITYINKQEIVSLDFNLKLSPIYRYTLHIAFTGIISNTGSLSKTSYVNKEGRREWLIATHNSGIGTRRLFPCWDEPRFKANFTISLKHHNSYTAFSNMPSTNERREKDMIVTRFSTSPAIPTYLIAIGLMCLSKYSIFSMGYKLSGRWQVTEHLTYAVSTIEKFTQAFENEWPYLKDYLSEQHIAIPGWLDDGMDKWQIVFYREANVIYYEEIDPLGRKIEISRLIARKVAGQLIGSAIISSQWSHLWLHEGISTLLGINILNKTFPDFRMMDLFVVQTLQESLRLDVNTFMKSLTSEINNISDINSLFSFSYYLKGPVILRMIQHVLGNEVLQEGINIYMKLQSSSPDSFWTAMQAAYNNKTTEDSEEFNIRRAMNSWINQNHYPILNVERFEDREIVTISTQNASDTWWIPVTYNMQTQINFNNTLPQIWLRSSFSLISYNKSVNTSISTPNLKANWIIFNLQQTGYYRVNYCTEGWRTITNYLSSKDYTKVHVLNRAQIIDDAFYFMITNQLKSSVFWELTIFLSQETDYIVWYPMFKAIEYLSCMYGLHENQQFKARILNLLVPLLREVGYKEYSHENHLTKCLRQEAAKWACILGDEQCKSIANAALKNRLSNTINNISPWWREWTYCHGLSIADNITINKIFNTYLLTESDTIILEFLACSDSYLHVVPILMYLKKLKPHNGHNFYTARGQNMITRDYINMFHHILQRHANNELVLQYILLNWNEIKPKEITLTAALINIINHVHSTNHLNKIDEFIKNLEKETPTDLLNHTSFELSPLRMFDSSHAGQAARGINEIIKESDIKALSSRTESKINIRLSQIGRHMDSFIFIDDM